jgi:hypothetical protein
LGIARRAWAENQLPGYSNTDNGTKMGNGEPPQADATRPKREGLLRRIWQLFRQDALASGTAARQMLFRALVLDYETLPKNAPPTLENTLPYAGQLDELIKALIENGKNRHLTWLELYDFESVLMRLRGDASLRRAVWGVRDEFQRLATAELWASYVASKPPDPNNPDNKIEDIRGDVEDLLQRLHELRLGRAMLDGIRAYTTSITLVVCIAMAAAIFYLSLHNRPNTSMLLLAAVAGASGAGFSMLNRLSQIPSKGDLIARYPGAHRRIVWVLTPLLSLIEGMLGAIVLYFLFRANLVSGDLFPKLNSQSGPLSPTADVQALNQLFSEPVPLLLVGAKLIIWSFIAGFSERLVPDMLTRLTEQAEKMEAPQAIKLT